MNKQTITRVVTALVLTALLLFVAACVDYDEIGADAEMGDPPYASEFETDDPDAVGSDDPGTVRNGDLQDEAGTPAGDVSTQATATLTATEGSDVAGIVMFTPTDEGVRIEARVTGLDDGAHGFHIHETGDCSAPDASSAEAHFAPRGSPHGAPSDPADERHRGDLGNLEAGEDGIALYDRVHQLITLQGSSGIVGKAVIVHRDRDDLTSQPGGSAGPRQACGVISLPGAGEDAGSDPGEL